jgi:hypothetical protein
MLPAAALATVGLVVLLADKTLPTARVFAIWFVLLAGAALLALLRADEDEAPQATSRFEQALARGTRRASTRPAVFLGMERELELGSSRASYAHRRLLPLLRSAAAARLQSRHGIELERNPDAARTRLGEEAWELLRPDRPAPADPFGPGPSPETIAALIERVEAL